jgi:hypothetical protein
LWPVLTSELGPAVEQTSVRPKPIPWRTIFRELSQRYGWNPNEIGEMTLAQIFVYYLQATSPGETVSVEPGRLRVLQSRLTREREWWMADANRRLGLQ